MQKFIDGLSAGLTATIVLSVLMLIKSALGLLPQFNAIAILAELGNQYAGLPATPMLGWILHFVIGAVLWGLLFAGLAGMIPGPNDTVKGIEFGVVAWLLMMILVMPLAGAGLFAVQMGIGVAIATLVLHIIFGAVLGAVFGRMTSRSRTSVVVNRPGAP